MDSAKGKGKKGLITKTWERCKSFGARGHELVHENSSVGSMLLARRSRSWPRGLEEDEKRSRKQRVCPEGCFSVHVGPQKQRFVIKTDYINHPLFRVLLEEAELEYGYKYSEGPIVLPCDVDVFLKVLVEMDDHSNANVPRGCNFVRSHGSYHHLTPSRLMVGHD